MRRRAIVAVGASLLLHAVPLAIVLVLPAIHLPEPPIPVEVRAPHRTVEKTAKTTQAGAPKSEAKAPPKPGKPAHAAAHPRAKGEGIAKVPAPPPPPQTADLSPFAPGDAKIVVLLHTDRMRKSPHKEGVEALLEALPDYDTLLGGTGLRAIDDFDALLIATANPLDVTATFLAARHKSDPKLRAALEKRTIPSWDPRVFRFLRPTLSVLARPEAARALDGNVDGGVPENGGDERDWLAQLERFDRAAGKRDDAPALLVTMSDVPSLARLGMGLPTPSSLALAATADAAPALRLKLRFASTDEAEQFAAAWPEIVRRWRQNTLLAGLGGMLDGLQVDRQGDEVEVQGRILEVQMRIALGWARALLPRHVSEVAAPPDGGEAPNSPVDSGAQ